MPPPSEYGFDSSSNLCWGALTRSRLKVEVAPRSLQSNYRTVELGKIDTKLGKYVRGYMAHNPRHHAPRSEGTFDRAGNAELACALERNRKVMHMPGKRCQLNRTSQVMVRDLSGNATFPCPLVSPRHYMLRQG